MMVTTQQIDLLKHINMHGKLLPGVEKTCGSDWAALDRLLCIIIARNLVTPDSASLTEYGHAVLSLHGGDDENR